MTLLQKESLQINIKTHINIPIEKWIKDLNRQLKKTKYIMQRICSKEDLIRENTEGKLLSRKKLDQNYTQHPINFINTHTNALKRA